MGRCRVRLGVVGLGHLGRFHARNLATKVPEAELACVVDERESLAREVASELGVDWAPEYDAMLADDRIVGVVIVTPTSLHAEMIERAVAAGKHVFTEKPLSLDVATGVRAVEAAERVGMVLQVGFHRRFDPDYVSVARRIKHGEIGATHFFRSTHRDMRAPRSTAYLASDGNFFLDALIHDFDCARWLVGEVLEVSSCGVAVGSQMFADVGDVDNVIVTLRFACGAIGVVDGSRAAGYGYEAAAEVLGTSGTLRISNNRVTNVECLASGRSKRDYVEDFRDRFARAYVGELAAFVQAIRGTHAVRAGGADALAAFRIAEAASQSHIERRAVAVGSVEH